MNPADFGMFWMNQYAQAQERMIIDDSTSYYTQPSIGMSVMDDLNHQTNTMVSFVNPKIIIINRTIHTIFHLHTSNIIFGILRH